MMNAGRRRRPADHPRYVPMSQLVVLTFDTEDQAKELLGRLRGLEKAGQISFEDTAIITRDPDGKTHLNREVSGTTEIGAVAGGIIGLLVGGLLFPIGGLVLGAAAGGAIGASLGTGVDRKFVEDVKAKLEPGKSALFLVVKEANADTALAAVRGFHGEVLQTTLDADVEQQLRDALK
jgi:uncharacterized membrane protein